MAIHRGLFKAHSSVNRPHKKSEKFFWSDECGRAFEELKQRFTSAPILRHYDSDLPYIIECDPSDFAIGAVLSQEFEGRLHPVAFYSRKMNKHEINYEIHDKELLAITAAFKEWRRYLEGARHKISVYTDHRGLECRSMPVGSNPNPGPGYIDWLPSSLRRSSFSHPPTW